MVIYISKIEKKNKDFIKNTLLSYSYLEKYNKEINLSKICKTIL